MAPSGAPTRGPLRSSFRSGCRAGTPCTNSASRRGVANAYTLEILRAADAPNPPPPISTFRKQEGKRGVVVFVYWRGLYEPS